VGKILYDPLSGVNFYLNKISGIDFDLLVRVSSVFNLWLKN